MLNGLNVTCQFRVNLILYFSPKKLWLRNWNQSQLQSHRIRGISTMQLDHDGVATTSKMASFNQDHHNVEPETGSGKSDERTCTRNVKLEQHERKSDGWLGHSETQPLKFVPRPENQVYLYVFQHVDTSFHPLESSTHLQTSLLYPQFRHQETSVCSWWWRHRLQPEEVCFNSVIFR
ncbi:hypothetical protein BC629DRAFT_1721043 [Irpex lacteus]|nr:hypothetical protein BC629DRAFT_1721043 [Irpex lacteus]